jgi:hypothetical protein
MTRDLVGDEALALPGLHNFSANFWTALKEGKLDLTVEAPQF